MAGAAFFAERRGCEVAVVWQRRRRFRPAIALPQHILAQFKIKIRLFEILSPLPRCGRMQAKHDGQPQRIAAERLTSCAADQTGALRMFPAAPGIE